MLLRFNNVTRSATDLKSINRDGRNTGNYFSGNNILTHKGTCRHDGLLTNDHTP